MNKVYTFIPDIIDDWNQAKLLESGFILVAGFRKEKVVYWLFPENAEPFERTYAMQRQVKESVASWEYGKKICFLDGEMTKDSKLRLCDKGFVMVRLEKHRKLIKYAEKPGAWKILKKCKTDAELVEAWKESLDDPYSIEL